MVELDIAARPSVVLYVGIKTPRTFVQKGENIDVESIVTDIDGKLVAGRDVEIKAVLKDWQFDKGTWAEKTDRRADLHREVADRAPRSNARSSQNKAADTRSPRP